VDADDLTPEQWLKRLRRPPPARGGDLEALDDHYEGAQELSYMAPELLAELGDRLRRSSWRGRELVVDALEERLDIDGFRLGGEADGDEDLRAIWQANDLDEASSQGHIDAMVMRRFYGIVGDNEDDETADHHDRVAAGGVRRARPAHPAGSLAAAKWWHEEPEDKGKVEHATLYLPNETSFWVKRAGVWVPDDDARADRARLRRRPGRGVREPAAARAPRRVRPFWGVSELAPILPLSDAACKIATDMMVSAASSTRCRAATCWAPTRAISRTPTAARVRAPRAPAGLGVHPRQGRTASRSGSSPRRTSGTSTKRSRCSRAGRLDRRAPAVTYLGLSTDNPASRTRSARRGAAGQARRAQAAGVRRLLGAADAAGAAGPRRRRPDEARRMETLWRDAATPTVAQAADAAVKLYQSGVIPKRQTRRDLGYTDVQIGTWRPRT
jgi:hypothetical protein